MIFRFPLVRLVGFSCPMGRNIFLLAGLIASSLAMNAQSSRFELSSFGKFSGDIPADTALIQRAIDACATAGGGVVVVPAGTHATIASIRLPSHVELHLERGAVLQASPRHADFGITIPYPVTTRPEDKAPPTGVMIYADGADDVGITGAGVIDGNGPAYVATPGVEIHQAKPDRPFTVVFRSCRHATLRDVTIRNGAFWTVRMLGCDDVLISQIRIDNDMLMPNNDGLDIDWSSNVRITGCNISSGDDCISLKTAPQATGITQPCENVLVTGCTLMSRSSGIVVGCDVCGLIRNVVCDDCVIRNSHRGVSVRLSLEGSIEHVLFSNLVIETRLYDPKWWGRATPIDIVNTPWNEFHHVGRVRDIRFSNIVCRGENGVVVYGSAPGQVEGVTFDRVSVHIDKTTDYAGGQQDLRPALGDQMPRLPYSGFLLRNAAGVAIRDCRVTWGEHRPDYYQSAIDAEGCPGLEVRDFVGESAAPGKIPARLIR